MKKKNKIKVVIGDIVRESVMIGSNGEVLAEGQNSRQLLKQVYER